MTSTFLPSTRYCGYSENSTCYNCYSYGGGGPCSNCVLNPDVQMKAVDWKEFRSFKRGLPLDYQVYINNSTNQYERAVTPPNGTWDELMLKIKHQKTADYETNTKPTKIKRSETLKQTKKIKIKKIVNAHWYTKLALDRKSRPGTSKSRWVSTIGLDHRLQGKYK